MVIATIPTTVSMDIAGSLKFEGVQTTIETPPDALTWIKRPGGLRSDHRAHSTDATLNVWVSSLSRSRIETYSPGAKT
jgi:hypothetical protein